MNAKSLSRSLVTLLATLLVSLVAGAALADPLPDEILKFRQVPMVATPIEGVTYFGHDELSTAYRDPAVPTPFYSGTFMADDFADRFDTPVVHVRWWGSYLHQQTQAAGVKEFLVSFEKDVPAPPTGGFSHPGEPLLSQVVKLGPLAPMSGTFTETLIRGPDPLLGEALYEYNAELHCPFPEQRDTVYWLKIVALVDPQRDGPLEWGWHNRDYTIPDPFASTSPLVVPGEHLDGTLPDGTPIYHFQDDAVSGSIVLNVLEDCLVPLQQTGFVPKNYLPPFDGPTPIANHSKDLAFELHTRVPEPSSIILLLLGGIGLMGLVGRKRS